MVLGLDAPVWGPEQCVCQTIWKGCRRCLSRRLVLLGSPTIYASVYTANTLAHNCDVRVVYCSRDGYSGFAKIGDILKK